MRKDIAKHGQKMTLVVKLSKRMCRHLTEHHVTTLQECDIGSCDQLSNNVTSVH